MKKIMFIAFMSASVVASGAPSFTAETDNPTNNMFAVGSDAFVTFHAKEWAPNESREVSAEIFDHLGAKTGGFKVRLQAGPDGKGSVRAKLPTSRFGFCRVKARAGDLSLPKLGTRPAGEFTYGVAMDPKDRPELSQEQAFQGIHGDTCGESYWLGAHHGFATTFADDEKKAEWDAARAKLPWKRYGLMNVNVGGHLVWVSKRFSKKSAQWLKDHSNGRKKNAGIGWNMFSDPEALEVYKEWLDIKIGDFMKRPANPCRRVYEIFWEPNLTVPDAETMVKAAEVAHRLIKERDPEALIALPTITNCSNFDWHRQVFEKGILKYADVFDLHPYIAYPPEPNGYIDNIRTLKRMLADYGRPDIPFVCSESGHQTPATLAGELIQLEGQVRVHLILMGEGIWFNCPFYGADYGGDHDDHREGDYGIMYNLDYPHPRFGPKHISPRPVFCGISAFSMLLDGFRPKECIDFLGGTRWGYVYTNAAGRCTAALWDYGGATSKVELPVGREEIATADIMGNKSTTSSPGGVLRLELGSSPVYVFEPDPAAWEKGTKALRAAAEAEARAREAAPVKLLSAEPTFSDGHPAVAAEVLNNSDEKRSVCVKTRIKGEPDARRSAAAELAPRETKRVTVRLDDFRPDPFALFDVEIGASDGAGNSADRKMSANFLSAKHLPGVGKGGDFSGWKDPARIHVPFRVVGNEPFLKDEKDLSAEIAFAWNEDFLLLDVLVKDDVFKQEHTGWHTWNGDALQFGFARRRLERLTANDYADALDQGTTEVDFALTKRGPEAYRTISFDPYKLPSDMFGKGQIDLAECPLSIDRRDVPGGVELHYRIAFPWRFMNKKEGAKAGENVYFAMTVNDRDDDDKFYSAIGLFELKRLAPRHFGTISLCE